MLKDLVLKLNQKVHVLMLEVLILQNRLKEIEGKKRKNSKRLKKRNKKRS